MAKYRKLVCHVTAPVYGIANSALLAGHTRESYCNEFLKRNPHTSHVCLLLTFVVCRLLLPLTCTSGNRLSVHAGLLYPGWGERCLVRTVCGVDGGFQPLCDLLSSSTRMGVVALALDLMPSIISSRAWLIILPLTWLAGFTYPSKSLTVDFFRVSRYLMLMSQR